MRPDGWRPFRLTLEIAPGWHLQANPASEPYLVPTEVGGGGGGRGTCAIRKGSGSSPATRKEAIAVYSGRVEITGEVSSGGKLALTYQPCDEARCLPPVTRGL